MDYKKLLSDNVKGLKPSGIRRFFDILEEMDDAISLGIGEPDFVTPWHIRDAGIYSLEKGYTKYTGNAGLTRLRKAISVYLKRRFDLEYNYKDQIIVTVGGSEAIDLTVRALVNPGDEVIIPIPSFVCYGPVTELACGKAVYVETTAENGFRLTADALRAAITPKTKLLILPYPNNPTGGIMEKQDLESIADVLRGTEIMVLSDEIYAELTYGQRHFSLANIPDMYERTIVVNGFSKSHAMTGWRMGYVCGPAQVISQMLKIHQYAIMSAPTASQYAAIEAIGEGDGDIDNMRRDYDLRRRYLLDGLRSLNLNCFEPKGAFYMFPCIKRTGLTSEEFCERFLLEEKVAVIPGEAFGSSGEGFVRICYASSIANISEALKRMERFLKNI
ncbi:MAG: aminotransferase class I/II-fold pyridoxal phosphate-dependent enzyme [Clostridiales bacterium]|nr:aminotransferase class I/II-fold pyridoxal phosphate-dependent enzyme [Clostridiales bacterium]